MFKHNNLTDFEKLLFSERKIIELYKDISQIKIEKGKLQSEIDELKYLLKKENPENNKLQSYKKEIKVFKERSKKYKLERDKYFNEIIVLKQQMKHKL